jgi:hypothetical protein
MPALGVDAVLSVKVIHSIQSRAEAAQRHDDVYEVRGVSFDSLRVLSAFAAGLFARVVAGQYQKTKSGVGTVDRKPAFVNGRT